MTTSIQQSIFLQNFAKLILWTFSQGWVVTAGELFRCQEMQDIYLQKGLTKTSHSKHQDKMAGDLNLFVNGVYQSNREAYKPLAQYWKSLNPDNKAGYDWGWDANHFEYNPK